MSPNTDSGGFGDGGSIGSNLIGLGADSAATAALFLAGSSSAPFQTLPLKTSSQPALMNTQPVTLTFALSSPVTATALGSVTISLIPGVQLPNTWSIQSIQVVLSNRSGTPPPVMLLNQTGSDGSVLPAPAPIVVLSGSNSSITLPL
jgi:hypothetical protein